MARGELEPEDFMDELVKEARKRVSGMLGGTLAAKATPAFCLAFGLVTPEALALDTAGPTMPLPSSVIEFEDKPELTSDISNAVDGIRYTKAWEEVRRALKMVQFKAAEGLPLNSARLLRSVKITSLRDEFFKASGNVRYEIERSAGRFFHFGLEAAASIPAASTVTDVCWLNRSLRARVHPRDLSEIVADPSIQSVDVPRRLQAEINVSADTVGAPQFRKKFAVTGRGVIVAVIDSEVVMDHPSLTNRVVQRQNFTKEPWGNPGSHGTAVAGIIASNDAEFNGIAPEATIYNYKVLATNSELNGEDFDGALAIQQAAEDGVHVANCSWGVGAASDGKSRESRACNKAWTVGLAIVKSAGNGGPDASTLTIPADADGVIVVGATDREGKAVQDYSSRGPTDGKQRPHLVAPGGSEMAGITSCLVSGGFGDCGTGTTLAAPHVAGLLALLLELDPNLTPDKMRAALLSACTPIAGLDINTQGVGVVSVVS